MEFHFTWNNTVTIDVCTHAKIIEDAGQIQGKAELRCTVQTLELVTKTTLKLTTDVLT